MSAQTLQMDQVGELWKPDYQSSDHFHRHGRLDVYKALCERIDCYHNLYLASGGIDNRKKAKQLERQAWRFLECGQNSVLFKCVGCQRLYAGFSRCESRICPDCMRKFASALWHRAEQVVKAYPPHGTLRWMLLTLTIKVEGFRVLQTADFKKLTKDARKLINALYPKDQGAGAIAVIEVGKGKNLHVHALVYGEYHAQSSISRLWNKITGTSKIVDIRASHRPMQSLQYIIKYIAKPPQFDSAGDVAEYLDAIIGVRRLHTYGIFYNHGLLKREPVNCPICGGRLKYRSIHPGESLPLDTLLFSEAFEKSVMMN